MAGSDSDLQAWLDEASESLKREEAIKALREKNARATGIPTWEQQKYNFKVSLYRKAISA